MSEIIKMVSPGRTPEAKAEQQRKRRAANPEKYRKRYAKYQRSHNASKMGILTDIDKWYDKQLQLQGGKCALPDCLRPAEDNMHGRLDMDHDPQTGKFRALLCRSCNTKLGIYEKRKMVFESYIKAHRRGR